MFFNDVLHYKEKRNYGNEPLKYTFDLFYTKLAKMSHLLMILNVSEQPAQSRETRTNKKTTASLTVSMRTTSAAGLFLDWRWLAICCSVPPTLLMVCMCFMPETPRFLLSQGKRREAEDALRFLRGPDAPVEWECARIADACQERVSEKYPRLLRSKGQTAPNDEMFCQWELLRGLMSSAAVFPLLAQSSGLRMSDLKDPGVYKPLVIGVMLMVFQQMTGINAIMFYAENIFEQAHFKVRVVVFLKRYLFKHVQFGTKTGSTNLHRFQLNMVKNTDTLDSVPFIPVKSSSGG